MSRLTDLGIRRAKAKASVYTLSDGRGLSLRIEPSGAKLWHFRFYWQGKQQRISFGYFPEVDLSLARERREETRQLLARGIDPRLVEAVEEDSVSSVAGVTFGEFAEQWKALKLLKLGTELKQRQSTRVQIERYLRKDLLPSLGHLPLDSISQREVLVVLRQIEARGALSIAEKCRGWLNELFRHAIAEGLISVNPVNDVDVVLLPCRPPRHNPFLRMNDLPELLGRLEEYQGDRRIVLGIKLLLLTAVRPGELRYAEPCHFDLVKGVWNVPPEQVKQLQRLALSLPKGSVPPFMVPLPRQAIEIVEELLRLHFRGQKYVLPHRSEPQLCISENYIESVFTAFGL